jgi:sulfatase maturation enzyme AslB (radical SAM superfamily)
MLKQIRFSLTTNGSLMDADILQFLRRNKFYVMLSFDGRAQEKSRKEGSSEKIESVIDDILDIPEIEFATNSVFIPSTVGFLSESIQYLMGAGVSDINLSLSNFPSWDQTSLFRLREELSSVRKFSLVHYERNQRVPVSFLRKKHERGIFRCAAGRNRMALAPDGTLWGCYLFADYFKGKEESQEYSKYCFGSLDSFIKNHEEIYPEVFSHYSNLFMDIFSTPEKKCFFCHDVEDCVVCPVEVAFSSSVIGKIPHWTCQIRQLLRNENHAFWEELEGQKTEMDSSGIQK